MSISRNLADIALEVIGTDAGTSNAGFGTGPLDSIASGGNYNTALGDSAGTAISTEEDDFNEYAFRSAANTASYSSNSVTYDDFKTFSVKVVLASSTPYDPPRVRDLRVIALDS